MRILLDTHAFLWWQNGSPKLSSAARRAVISSEQTLVSAASAWEIATKFRLGKLPEAAAFAYAFEQALDVAGFMSLPITGSHGQLAGTLAGSPKDPFDRILIAQARMEGLTLVSNEKAFDVHDVRRLW